LAAQCPARPVSDSSVGHSDGNPSAPHRDRLTELADTFTVIEGAPHASNVTHPEQVNEAMLNFLRMLDE
jgi:pimeloyl-ACP methyl ester carboxylesterase